jgi:predicted DCC family thiol-disulfide oxidoreductase YuxK
MKVIFYDGNCPMCNAWVTRFLRWDKKKILHFAPLQSEVADRMMGDIFPGFLSEDTVVYFDQGKTFTRSTAILKIMNELGWRWAWCRLGVLVPKPLRDRVYKWIAARRYRYGKRYEECPLPPHEWKDRFI